MLRDVGRGEAVEARTVGRVKLGNVTPLPPVGGRLAGGRGFCYQASMAKARETLPERDLYERDYYS